MDVGELMNGTPLGTPWGAVGLWGGAMAATAMVIAAAVTPTRD
jgi:hypothetical protein